jgi:branched-subunit amino acid transport protein
MTATGIALLLLAAGTYALKAIGPVAAAGRELSPAVTRAADLLPAALLAALVATETVGRAGGLTFDARLVGVGAAALAVWRGAPFGLVVVIGAGVTALVRALGWG